MGWERKGRNRGMRKIGGKRREERMGKRRGIEEKEGKGRERNDRSEEEEEEYSIR